MRNKNFNKIEDDFLIFLSSGLLVILLTVFNFNLSAFRSLTIGQVLQATNPAANTVRFYYDAGGQRIAKINPLVGNTYYINPSLEVVISPTGAISWRRNYSAGGKVLAVKTNIASAQTTPAPLTRPQAPAIGNPAATSTPVPTLVPTGNPYSNLTLPTTTPLPTLAQSPNTSPVITTGSLVSGRYGEPYSASIRGYDADCCRNNLTVTATNLPSGISFGGCSQYIREEGKVIYCTISGTTPRSVTKNVVVTLSDGITSVSKTFVLDLTRPPRDR